MRGKRYIGIRGDSVDNNQVLMTLDLLKDDSYE